MTVDVLNAQNEKVGSLELSDAVFGGRPKLDLVWEAVVHEDAGRRRGTHATKTRAEVAGSGRKPWRQKGTGRARVGEVRNPLWRKGGTVFGPQPRDYAYALPRKVRRGALRAALVQKIAEGALLVVDQLAVAEPKTREAKALLETLGATGRTLLLDVTPEENLALATRNLPGTRLVPSNRVTARDVMQATRIIATTGALERLQAALGRPAEGARS